MHTIYMNVDETSILLLFRPKFILKKAAEGYIRFGHLFIAIPSHIGVAQFTGHKYTMHMCVWYVQISQ